MIFCFLHTCVFNATSLFQGWNLLQSGSHDVSSLIVRQAFLASPARKSAAPAVRGTGAVSRRPAIAPSAANLTGQVPPVSCVSGEEIFLIVSIGRLQKRFN